MQLRNSYLPGQFMLLSVNQTQMEAVDYLFSTFLASFSLAFFSSSWNYIILKWVALLSWLLLLQKSSAPEHLKLQYLPDDVSEDSLVAQKEVKQYRDAVSDMLNGSEDEESLQRYGNSVRKLLNIKGNTLWDLKGDRHVGLSIWWIKV